MYEENNSQDKPVVIGIDHGFSFMKTKHHIFGNGVVRCNGRPPVAENSFYYDGNYYCIGGERKTVQEDKTADEDFFLLTLVAVAKEIKTRELPRTLRVVLGVGVPFKRFGKEQAKLVAYLKWSGPHFIEFEEEDYVITIENVYCFPQCFAAVADRIGNMHGQYVVADIGSWTKDIICIDERKVQSDKCVTIPNSIISVQLETDCMNPKTLQYLMGHSDIGVTLNTYTHFKFEDAQAEVLLMDESCRKKSSQVS